MPKRFKFRYRKKHKSSTIFFITITIFTSLYFFYSILYHHYLSKLTNKEIITYIINHSKNNTYDNQFIENYLKPETILSNYFNFTTRETITVNNKVETSPLVYIYCTHETEGYQDNYLEVYNIKPTVKHMAYILSDYLSDLGIYSIVEPTSISSILKEHNWSYKYSYEASKLAIKETINTTNSLKLIIDLHRDSSSLSKTLLETKDKEYAKILFVIGGEHENYLDNYEVAENLKKLLENEVPGITRGITVKSGSGVNGIYNQDLSNKSVLIELGGQYNEIDQLNNTLNILSKVILKYIEGEI